MYSSHRQGSNISNFEQCLCKGLFSSPSLTHNVRVAFWFGSREKAQVLSPCHRGGRAPTFVWCPHFQWWRMALSMPSSPLDSSSWGPCSPCHCRGCTFLLWQGCRWQARFEIKDLSYKAEVFTVASNVRGRDDWFDMINTSLLIKRGLQPPVQSQTQSLFFQLDQSKMCCVELYNTSCGALAFGPQHTGWYQMASLGCRLENGLDKQISLCFLSLHLTATFSRLEAGVASHEPLWWGDILHRGRGLGPSSCFCVGWQEGLAPMFC